MNVCDDRALLVWQVDIYALGVLMWSLVTRSAPWSGRNVSHIVSIAVTIVSTAVAHVAIAGSIAVVTPPALGKFPCNVAVDTGLYLLHHHHGHHCRS